jgi:hypothetical protein
VSAIEDRVRDALRGAGANVEPYPDLFARVTRSVEADRERRGWRWRVAGYTATFVLALAAFAAATSDLDNGRIAMPWWVLELITTVVLVAIAAVLGPFIKRFGRSYAADVFRANPRTGKSYLVLTDVAYYLIFVAYILFTMRFEPAGNWDDKVIAEQVHHEVARVGGILLLLGLLHAANIVMLPVIGRMLSLNRKLDEHELGAGRDTNAPPAPSGAPRATVEGTSLGSGAWVLRIEPAGPAPEPAPGVARPSEDQ